MIKAVKQLNARQTKMLNRIAELEAQVAHLPSLTEASFEQALVAIKREQHALQFGGRIPEPVTCGSWPVMEVFRDERGNYEDRHTPDTGPRFPWQSAADALPNPFETED